MLAWTRNLDATMTLVTLLCGCGREDQDYDKIFTNMMRLHLHLERNHDTN